MASKAAGASRRRVRKCKDVYPAIRERCVQYTNASKWQKLENMTPGIAKLWVQQMSIWTRSIFKMRGHAYANCPHPLLRRKLLEVVQEEDIVDPRVGMNHRQMLARSFGEATGQSLKDLEKVRPLATTQITIDLFHGIADKSWMEGFAISSGHERILKDTGFFKVELKRFSRDLGWNKKQLAWFTGHDAADEDHGALVNLLDKFIVEDAHWELVAEAIVQSQLAWLILLDGVVDAHAQGIKPMSGASCRGLSFYF